MNPSEVTVIINPGASGDAGSPKMLRLAAVARSMGFQVHLLECTQIPNPEERVSALLSSEVATHSHLILVGSSMGGYVAAIASETLVPLGLFLIGPALYLEPYKNLNPEPRAKHISIVHGWHDTVVLPSNAYRFAEQFRADIHFIDSDHSLNAKVEHIGCLFGLFLRTCIQ